jgi:tetratricopeptide (TPR) repeat protein
VKDREEKLMKRSVLVIVVALAVLVGGAIVGRPRSVPQQRASIDVATASPEDLLRQHVASIQERLRRIPADWTAWAALGMAYLEQARVTSDPSYYPKAEQAVTRSLALRRSGNSDALVARAALANARHEFAGARRDALSVLGANPYHADAYAVLADAETQLGHRAAATAAIQHLVNLRPGLPAYARASYDLEQRGLTVAATDLMRAALVAAVDRHDIGFCRVQLGDLAFGSGDLTGATAEYAAGLLADPTSIGAQ